MHPNDGGGDKYRPTPGRKRGQGLVTIGRPLGLVVGDQSGAYDSYGLISHAREVFMVDPIIYQVLDLCRWGQSPEWVGGVMDGLGISERCQRDALTFALDVGLLAKYDAKDGRLDGRRSLAKFIMRRRGVPDPTTPIGSNRILIPEGVLTVSAVMFDFWQRWRDQQLAWFGVHIFSSRPVAEDVIKWSFWLPVRGLGLGILWLDAEAPSQKLREGPGAGAHWAKPASLWMMDPMWPRRSANFKYLHKTYVNANVYAQSLGVPTGRFGVNGQWHIRNWNNQDVIVDADEFALFSLADVVRPSQLAERLAAEIGVTSQIAIARILAAADRLEAKRCIRFETAPPIDN